jgi:hypothetical protein
MRMILRSKTGIVLAAAYLIATVAMYYAVLTCKDGFFCGIIALPAMLPSGFIYSRLLAGHVSSPAILQWQIVVPVAATNTVLYYLLGWTIGAMLGRLFKR